MGVTRGNGAAHFTVGKLLIAEPMLGDPNFERSVVLMIEHTEDGALGVVLNKPTHLEVAAVLDEWAELAEDAWLVVEAAVDDVFAPDAETMWREVLRRQGGKLAMLANFPPHPSMN